MISGLLMKRELHLKVVVLLHWTVAWVLIRNKRRLQLKEEYWKSKKPKKDPQNKTKTPLNKQTKKPPVSTWWKHKNGKRLMYLHKELLE